jgi:hypothetical protein
MQPESVDGWWTEGRIRPDRQHHASPEIPRNAHARDRSTTADFALKLIRISRSPVQVRSSAAEILEKSRISIDQFSESRSLDNVWVTRRSDSAAHNGAQRPLHSVLETVRSTPQYGTCRAGNGGLVGRLAAADLGASRRG